MTELGTYLKEQREALGVSLEQIQTTTKIQKRYIVAIEEGNYDQLPGAFYARAFIKTYAEALGLDVDEVFTTYKRDLPEPEAQPVVELSRRATYSKSSAPKKSVAKRWIPNIIIIVLIFAIGAALYYGLQTFLDGNEEAKTSAPKQNDVTIDQGDAPSKETDAPAKTEEEPKEEPAKQEETKEEPKKEALAVKSTSGQDVTYEVATKDTMNVSIQIKKDASPSPFVGVRDTSLEGEALAPDHINASDPNPIVVKDAKTDLIRIRIGSIKGIDKIVVNDQELKLNRSLLVQNIYLKKVDTP
ncbi:MULTISPECIES: helix-turn-helix domain-containing protein [Exiguobacterium]|uniref:Helix-turn-helix domain-containing protein n=2 Tax=Bacillales Family XII. Incertae Sedis TaxID=539742 RepID=A0ABX8GDF5_EXIAC|nr:MULTISPECIES: helix-turn-helix domain-containing protein [Exiguobacterium]AOT01858.1 transcriptional regulator [Exiguobacterium sp. U13-1]QWB31110.1 helix-turn-helix domain-containing protein [Exiguobacterium acetylicum]HBQ76651.1 helix-turn-helix domain-containing protein [Exiguobacterium sp.]HCD58934.1 helix-turn-helix domain-containing protein [Exiguobacterium sp.]